MGWPAQKMRQKLPLKPEPVIVKEELSPSITPLEAVVFIISCALVVTGICLLVS